MRKISIMFVLFVLSFAFCACVPMIPSTKQILAEATTAKYNFATLFNLTPEELKSFATNPSTVTDFTDEQKSVELFVYDVENNLPAGISFNPKSGKVLLDFETYLFFMEYGYEDGQLVTYVRNIKSIGKEPYVINQKKDVCEYKTMLLANYRGTGGVLYVCEVKGPGLLKKATWSKVDKTK